MFSSTIIGGGAGDDASNFVKRNAQVRQAIAKQMPRGLMIGGFGGGVGVMSVANDGDDKNGGGVGVMSVANDGDDKNGGGVGVAGAASDGDGENANIVNSYESQGTVDIDGGFDTLALGEGIGKDNLDFKFFGRDLHIHINEDGGGNALQN